MSISIKKDNDSNIFVFETKRLDYSAVRQIEGIILNNISKSKKIVYDLQNVEFIASAFLRLCLEAVNAVGKDNFKISNTNDFILKILEVSHFDMFVK